MITNYYRSRI